MSLFAWEHQRQFKWNGFTVIEDAFDEELITNAREAIWEAIPEDRGDPQPWFARDGDHDEILHRNSPSDSATRFSNVEPFKKYSGRCTGMPKIWSGKVNSQRRTSGPPSTVCTAAT